MHIFIPLWVCWAGGIAAILVIGLVVGTAIVAGISEGDRDLEATLWKPYPDPRQPDASQPRQEMDS